MITEVTRILSAWISHPDFGVNALLPSVGRRHLDGSEDPMPPFITVYDDIDSVGGSEEDQALDIDPPKVPAIVVETVDLQIEVNLHDQNYLKTGEPVIVAFSYITRDVPARRARLDGGYTLRALRRSLYRYKNAPSSMKKLNDVTVLKLGKSFTQVVGGGVGKSEMWGLHAVEATVIDTNL